tara:strand:+ start:529 stop:954 length:426 start_codon:yes stop_codon:yes gene_type:complete
MSLSENLSDISLHYFALMRKIASKFELTLSQALVLLYIPFDGITISNLSNKLGIDISTMTRNIQRIQIKGLISKQPNLDDKRSIKVKLSNRGQKVVQSLNQDIETNIDHIFQKHDFEDIQKMHDILESLGWELYLYRQDIE